MTINAISSLTYLCSANKAATSIRETGSVLLPSVFQVFALISTYRITAEASKNIADQKTLANRCIYLCTAALLLFRARSELKEQIQSLESKLEQDKESDCFAAIAHKVVCATRFCFQQAEAVAAKNPWITRNIVWIDNHIGTACELAAVAAVVSFIAQGAFVTGGIMLTYLALEKISMMECVPLKYRNITSLIATATALVTSLMVGHWVFKVFNLMNAVSFVGNLILKQQSQELPPLQGVRVDDQVIDLPAINPDHIRPIKIEKPSPGFDLYAEITKLYENSALNAALVIDKARQDPKFQNEMQAGKCRDDYESIQAYLKQGLDELIRKIQEKKIADLPLQDADYDNLQGMLEQICKKPQPADAVVLALCGHHSGMSLFRTVAALYGSRISEKESPLNEKILDRLSLLRADIFKNIWKIVQEETQDSEYEGVRLYGDQFGLPLTAHTKFDKQNNRLNDMIIRAVKEKQFSIDEKFKSEYSSLAILRWLNEQIREEKVPLDLVKEWFVKWLSDRRNITREAAGQFFDEKITVRGKDFNEFIGIDGGYLNAMLLEMGVFKL